MILFDSIYAVVVSILLPVKSTGVFLVTLMGSSLGNESVSPRHVPSSSAPVSGWTVFIAMLNIIMTSDSGWERLMIIPQRDLLQKG